MNVAFELSSDRPLYRTALPAVALDEGCQRLRRYNRERGLKVTAEHPALPLFIELGDLLLDMHRINVDEAGASGKGACAFELKGADANRHDRADEPRFLEGLLRGDFMCGQTSNWISLRNDPAATSAARHQIELEASIGGELYGKGGDLVEHGNSGTWRDSVVSIDAISVMCPTYFSIVNRFLCEGSRTEPNSSNVQSERGFRG